MAASTAPYRVTVTHHVANGKYYAGSTDPRRANPTKAVRTHYYFQDLEAAKAFQDKTQGAAVYALTATGKSYRAI